MSDQQSKTQAYSVYEAAKREAKPQVQPAWTSKYLEFFQDNLIIWLWKLISSFSSKWWSYMTADVENGKIKNENTTTVQGYSFIFQKASTGLGC